MPLRRSVASTALLALALAACKSDGPPAQKLHVPSPAWEDQVIYFVMTDRFANGDKSNDDQGRGEFAAGDHARYNGGDLQGLIDRLDYIQGLGATALWITPPVANMWWDPLAQFGGYHGYWARNLKKVDEHLGTLDTYKALSHALHERGMYLIQDVVPNHMGNFFTWTGAYDPADPAKNFVTNDAAVPGGKPEGAPFDRIDVRDPAQKAAGVYHWTPMISDFTDPNQEVNYQISDLDDLNTENPAVRKALRDAYAYWIREVGVDAFRVDTAKFVPHDFWNDFFHSGEADAPGILAAAKATGRERFHAFGEVFEVSEPFDDAGDRKVTSYLGTPAKPELPGVLAFPLHEEINRVFATGKPTAQLGYRLSKFMDPALYPNPHAMPTFIDNHDVPRFLATGTVAGLDQALTFLFTIPGIPVVYYGTEQLFNETRAAMFQGGYRSQNLDHYDTAAPYYERVKKLAALRKSDALFTRGALQVVYETDAGPGAIGYRRTHEGRTALVLMNTADERVLVSGLQTGLAAGTVLESLDALKNAPLPVVGAGGAADVILPAKAVLIARATTQVVAPQTPAATITVGTAVEGQTFSQDVTLTGTVQPAGTALKLVLDGYLDKATDVPVAGDGSWSITLPVSQFPTGKRKRALAIYAPVARVSTPQLRFTADVAFSGQTLAVTDPVDDDKGPSGTYTYPQDTTFTQQMDVTKVVAEVGVTTMRLNLTMADLTRVWNPPNGFDHVAFNIYFEVPGQAGATVMPKLSGSVPGGFTWKFNQFSYGFGNAMYRDAGASATSYGTPATAPTIATDLGEKTIIFTYDRNAFGLASWSGVRVYVTTWDFDGIGGNFRDLAPQAGPFTMGGGAATDPKIMDEVAPFTLP